MLFSHRKGLRKVKDTFQKDFIDDDLKNSLWNVLQICVWDNVSFTYQQKSLKESSLNKLIRLIWAKLFKLTLDTLPYSFEDALKIIRKYFFSCEWYDIYDIIEFIANNIDDRGSRAFVHTCNVVLEREMSAYRFIDKRLMEITSEEEILSIEESLNINHKYKSVKIHIETSLILLSDRKKPDYRNSIKESICAVESLCKLILKDKKATLGKALNLIEKKHKIHHALKASFTCLYGYTSDSNGIRHALLEESDLTFIDARYMLVACAAFINYLIEKNNN